MREILFAYLLKTGLLSLRFYPFNLLFLSRLCQYLALYSVERYDKRRIGKDLEGSGHGPIQALI